MITFEFQIVAMCFSNRYPGGLHKRKLKMKRTDFLEKSQSIDHEFPDFLKKTISLRLYFPSLNTASESVHTKDYEKDMDDQGLFLPSSSGQIENC